MKNLVKHKYFRLNRLLNKLKTKGNMFYKCDEGIANLNNVTYVAKAPDKRSFSILFMAPFIQKRLQIIHW